MDTSSSRLDPSAPELGSPPTHAPSSSAYNIPPVYAAPYIYDPMAAPQPQPMYYMPQPMPQAAQPPFMQLQGGPWAPQVQIAVPQPVLQKQIVYQSMPVVQPQGMRVTYNIPMALSNWEPTRVGKLPFCAALLLTLASVIFLVVALVTPQIFECDATYYSSGKTYGYLKLCYTSNNECFNYDDLYGYPTPEQQAASVMVKVAIALGGLMILMMLVGLKVKKGGIMMFLALFAFLEVGLNVVALPLFTVSLKNNGACYSNLSYGGVLQIVTIIMYVILSIMFCTYSSQSSTFAGVFGSA